MNGNTVLVLTLLNQKHHEERDDGGAGVNHQLPAVRIVEQRAGYYPRYNNSDSQAECEGRARPSSYQAGERVENFCDGVSACIRRAGRVRHRSNFIGWTAG